MRAEKNSRGLESPRNHRPAAREVNPLLARISSEQRGQSKRKWNRKSRVPGIKRGRMNRHFRILKQGVEAASVRRHRKVENAAALRRKHLKRAGDKSIHDQEESLNSGENHSYIRHQLRMFA